MQYKVNRQSVRVAVIYIVVAGGWVLCSDLLFNFLASNPNETTLFDALKGLAFVLVTGGLMYAMLRHRLQEPVEQMRESEEKFAQMFQSSPVATSLSTVKEGRFLDVNETWLKLYERTRDEVLGHTVFELNLWAKLEQRAALFARLQAGEVVQNFELELRTKSGRVRQVLFSGTLMKVGDESCLLGSALDISERNRAERQIAEATHYVQTLLAASPIGIITFRADGQAVSANEAAARLVGTTVE